MQEAKALAKSLRGLAIPDASAAAELLERLADNEKLEWFVYEIFYANPIAFARKNLVIQLQRFLLGLPLVTPEEEQRQMLDQMTEDERAEWWRAENARRLAMRGVEGKHVG